MVKRRRRSRKWVSWLVFLVLLIVAGVVCYLVWMNYFKKDEGETTSEPVAEAVEEEAEVRPEVESEAGVDEVVDEKRVVLYDGEDPNEAEELTGVVTYAGVSGGSLMIRVNIDQYLTSGNCSLSLMENGTIIYSDTARIVGAAATATCEGFNVPTNEIGTGEFRIVIKLEADGKTGTINGEARV